MKSFLLTIFLVALFGIQPVSSLAQNSTHKSNSEKKWWKEAIVYQIYPRSFKDTDGDGIGDLKGIISKLDYIKSLGVTAVWLNPIYSSPNDDNGYDVSDYRDIMKDFGTMADFDALLKGLHVRGIKLIMDLVVNHSSDEHRWFKQSRSSRNSKYRNYYHWWPAEKGKPAPRYSLFDVIHDAWRYDSLTNAYYLHYFSRKQPDLNWENPRLRKEVYDIMKFWANKGIDGFRLDAFQFAAKDTSWPAFPTGYEKNFSLYYAVAPHLHDYLREMNKEVFSKYNVMSVAEGAGNSFKDAHDLVDADRKELNMAYAFDGVDIGNTRGYSLLRFKEVFSRWDSVFASKGWLSIFLANHDQARMVSRFGNDSPVFRDRSSKMLTTFIMTMRGTPYYYNGDELAMTNTSFKSVADFRDMANMNEYQHVKVTGGDTSIFFDNARRNTRDNGRTPFQWDNTTNAGFSNGTPWINVNPNYTTLNAEAQEKDPHSTLNFFRKVVLLRKKYPTLVYGKYKLLDKANPTVYAYLREGEGHQLLIVLNFSAGKSIAETGINLSKAKLLISNYDNASLKIKGKTAIELDPYEATVFSLN